MVKLNPGGFDFALCKTRGLFLLRLYEALKTRRRSFERDADACAGVQEPPFVGWPGLVFPKASQESLSEICKKPERTKKPNKTL